MSKRQKGPLPYPAPGIGAAWLGDSPAFGFGDGTLKLGEQQLTCHQGGMLAMQASPDGQSIWTAGDDGRLVQVDLQGQVHERLQVPRKWLDSLAISSDGSFVAVAAGQTVHVVGQDSTSQELRPPKGPTALAFAHDGQELAVTHSGGVSLFELSSGELVQEIPCAGGAIRRSPATSCRTRRAQSFSPPAALPYSLGRLWQARVRWANRLACIGRGLVW